MGGGGVASLVPIDTCHPSCCYVSADQLALQALHVVLSVAAMVTSSCVHSLEQSSEVLEEKYLHQQLKGCPKPKQG